MSDDTTPETEPSAEPPENPSLLFADATAQDMTEAATLAEQLSVEGLTFITDDILLAGYLSSFGETMLNGEPRLRTKPLKTLFDPRNPLGIRACAALGQVLQRVRQDAKRAATGEVEERDVKFDALDLAKTLVGVIASIAPDRRKVTFGSVAKKGKVQA